VLTEFDRIVLCSSAELVDSGLAVSFDVNYQGLNSWAFAIRFDGQVHAYLNRCAHVAMEMDFQPNRFFDTSGRWLICATHGALYQPQTGRCMAGPCRRGLVKIDLTEKDGFVHWHTGPQLQPTRF
jgi:nitrite reductase/ring-hydroxylating ferredoxin subunit